MSQGLGLNEGSDVESHTEEQDDTLTGSVNPPKAAQKMKTKKQKRKRKEMLQEVRFAYYAHTHKLCATHNTQPHTTHIIPYYIK